MAYDRAPRGQVYTSQTGPNVAPNSYKVTNEDTCQCKGTNWAPFLTCGRRTPSKPSTETPAPNAYFPKISNKIIGGNSLGYTAARFPQNEFFYPVPPLPETYSADEEPFPRLKGYMYHCHVPFTLLSYMPSIPAPAHVGYEISDDKRMWECCYYDNIPADPAKYDVNFETFATYYKGSFWSRYSGRNLGKNEEATPGVGDYNLIPEPNPAQEYLDKLRHERKKNACVLRYMEDVVSTAIRNNYPAPNQYNAIKHKCIRGNKKFVPKRPNLPKREVEKPENTTGPAPNQYNDPRTALNYLVKPSCKKGLSAFLTNAPRFQAPKTEERPSPNQYKIPSFLDELANKISPYAVRKTAFDTSVPKKLYYLPPENPIIIDCLVKPKPPVVKPKPVHPFSSKTKRFKPLESYPASCASYDVQKSFRFATAPTSFRRSDKYGFLSSEKRFKCPKIQTPVKEQYAGTRLMYYKPCGMMKGRSFARAKRFFADVQTGPGPLDYKIHSKSKANQTFNVTLGTGTHLTSFQKYRMKLKPKPSKKGSSFPMKSVKNCETKILTLDFPLKK